MKIFGFTNFSRDEMNIIENHMPTQNILNILGWFPFLGTIIGCIRIASNCILFVIDDDSDKHCHKKYYAISTIRGLIEIFSLGFLFVIPDVIASLTMRRKLKRKLKRQLKKEKSKQKNQFTVDSVIEL
jgi:hypothetical protein